MTRIGALSCMLLLLASTATAQSNGNLLVNGDFTQGPGADGTLPGWQLQERTTFAWTLGQVTLSTANGATGGLVQCINLDEITGGLTAGVVLQAAVEITALQASGGAFLLLGAHAARDCVGAILGSARGEPEFNTTKGTPLNTPVTIRGRWAVPPQTQSILFGSYSFTTYFALEFEYRMKNASLTKEEDAPPCAADLTIDSLVEDESREAIFSARVRNVGSGPTCGPYTVTVTAVDFLGAHPEVKIPVVLGDAVTCPDGKGSVTCQFSEMLEAGDGQEIIGTLHRGTGYVGANPPFRVTASVSGGGDVYPFNNTKETTVDPLRRRAEVIEQNDTARVTGRGGRRQ